MTPKTDIERCDRIECHMERLSLNGTFMEDKKMSKEYVIPARSGIKIDVRQGQSITVIDIEGGQVVDFLPRLTEMQMNFFQPE